MMERNNNCYCIKPTRKQFDLGHANILAGFLYANKIKKLEKQLSYRIKLDVTESVELCGSDFAKCPKCKNTMERDFQSYCDRCGQALSWKYY